MNKLIKVLLWTIAFISVVFGLIRVALYLRSKLPNGEQKWLLRLETELNAKYLKMHRFNRTSGFASAFDYVKDDPRLRRALIIGDSISIKYTSFVRTLLKGKVNVHRAPDRCDRITYGLKHIDRWLNNEHWDVIHFNFGLHDVNTTDEVYSTGLESLVTVLKQTNATLIWASTTPALPLWMNSSINHLNTLAEEVMTSYNIRINDLGGLINRHPHMPSLFFSANHFTHETYLMLAAAIAREILRVL